MFKPGKLDITQTTDIKPGATLFVILWKSVDVLCCLGVLYVNLHECIVLSRPAAWLVLATAVSPITLPVDAYFGLNALKAAPV